MGLSDIKYAFYGILTQETPVADDAVAEDSDKYPLKALAIGLVKLMEEKTKIVDFFSKEDEKRKLRREIKRWLVAENVGEETRKKIMNQFMELSS